MKKTRSLLPTKLTLLEAAELLHERLDCTIAEARQLVGRAIYDKSLQDVAVLSFEGNRLPFDVNSWRDIDWEEGTVPFETSYSGSPPDIHDAIPMLGRDEFFERFDLGKPSRSRRQGKSGRGRLPQYDWDAFWIEVCRYVHEQGVPETNGEMARIMLGWFADRGIENIDERTVEKKISTLFEILGLESE